MKRLHFFTAALLSVSLVLMIAACTGKQGEIGPAGPAGPQGPQGAAGPQGATGTANVIYSNWENITFSGSGTNYSASLNASRITQDVLDKADIKVYWRVGSVIYPLPYAQVLGSITYTMFPTIVLGKINFTASYGISSSTAARYIIIPGATPARLANVDYSNYEEVKKAYNLPD